MMISCNFSPNQFASVAILTLFIFYACAWLLIPAIQLYGRYDLVVSEIVW
jgi:hypothetical protein